MITGTNRKKPVTAMLILISMLMPVKVLGYQRVFAGDGGEVAAKVSASGLNRIAVEGSRITAIRGTAGEFEYDKDTTIGEVFIRPTGSGDKPIYVFISCDSGKSYTLALRADAKLPETIVIVPKEERQAKGKVFNSYETGIRRLINAMRGQYPIEGYTIKKIKIRMPDIKVARVTHIGSYIGESLRGEILAIENRSRKEMMLERKDFSYEGVRAIGITSRKVGPKEQALVYIIRD